MLLGFDAPSRHCATSPTRTFIPRNVTRVGRVSWGDVWYTCAVIICVPSLYLRIFSASKNKSKLRIRGKRNWPHAEGCPHGICTSNRFGFDGTLLLSEWETTGFSPVKERLHVSGGISMHWRWLCALCWCAVLWPRPAPPRRSLHGSTLHRSASEAVSLFWLSLIGFRSAIICGCFPLDHCEVACWRLIFGVEFCLVLELFSEFRGRDI